MIVRCRPLELPQQFTNANTKQAQNVLYRAISDMQSTHLEWVFIVAEDYNQANIKTVLPNLPMWILLKEGRTHWTRLHKHQEGIQGRPPSPPWLLRPTLCCANYDTQASTHQRKASCERGESVT